MFDYPVRLSLIINPWLWLGNIYAANDIELLQKHGIKRVLTISKRFGKDADFYLKHGVVQKRFAIPDGEFSDPDKRLLKELFPWVKESEKNSVPMLVHCFGSVSRSPGFIIAYLVWQGVDFWKAVDFVARLHPYAAPARAVMDSFLKCIGQKLPAEYKEWIYHRYFISVAPLLRQEENPTEETKTLRKRNYGDEPQNL